MMGIDFSQRKYTNAISWFVSVSIFGSLLTRWYIGIPLACIVAAHQYYHWNKIDAKSETENTAG
jgi:hypothetical protein